MNDDELDKLFGDSSEDKEETKPSSEGDVELSSNEESEESSKESNESEVTVVSEDEAVPEDKDKSSKEKKPDKKEKSVKNEKAELERKKAEEKLKEERKKKAQLERVQKIEEFEQKMELKAKERKARREAAGPILSRSYLDDFPVSFKTVLITLLVLVVLVLAWTLAFHPYFRVDRVTIVGNYEVSDEEIMQELGLEYGNHMFRNYYTSSKNLVSRNPYIQDISVSRKFPSTVTVEVKERKKIAYISTPDGYIAIDDSGIVLELSAKKDEEVRPLLCGLDINSATIGKKIDVMEDNSFRKMIIVLSAALSASEAYDGAHYDSYDFFGSIEEIRIIKSGMLFITVELPDGADLQVKLKDISSISDDMQWLIYAIEENAFEGLPDGVLDMTGEEYIYRDYEY
ncbi:MAG: FtsQ-type POTRA domain-containing protein [Saccharofermentans sp.]|nr:FtsQ-type POTRA domain-containing protein [Saccharofermentans sp.]